MTYQLISLVLGSCLTMQLGLGVVALYQERREKIRIKQAVSKFAPIQALIRKS